jgi:hypothetical protein
MSKEKQPKRIFITLGQCLAMVNSMNELDAQWFMFYEDTIMDDLNSISPYSAIEDPEFRNDLN